MRKVSETRAFRDHYDADVCIVWCFDNRFFKQFLWLVRQRFHYFDLVMVAGGAKDLASGTKAQRDYVLGQIAKSVRLHKTRRIALMVHIDCEAYGGSSNFPRRTAEVDNQNRELQAAERVVKKQFPKVEVELYLADFDGVYRV